jgi:hypothetical protein
LNSVWGGSEGKGGEWLTYTEMTEWLYSGIRFVGLQIVPII